ncbi:hypothetical protein FOXYS1_14420, partial [Fusarium oxysporum]
MTRWYSLPQEIRGMILGYIVIHDRIAPYTPVSIEWRDATERTFRHLRIQASSSDACGRTPTVFESLSRLCGRHRRLVKHIWLNIEHTKHPKWWDGSYNLSLNDRAIGVAAKRLFQAVESLPSQNDLMLEINVRLPRLEEIAFETWDLSDIHYGFSHGYRYAQHLLAAPDSFRNVKSMTVFQDRNKYFNAVSRLHKEELPRSHQANVVTPPVIPSRQPVLAWEFATASLYLEHLSIAFIIDAVDFFDQCREKWLWCELRSLTLTSQLLTCNGDSFKISGLLQTAAQMATHMPKLERLTIWNGGVNEACAFTYRKHQHNASVIWQAKGGTQIYPAVHSAWENVHSRCFLSVERKGTWPII